MTKLFAITSLVLMLAGASQGYCSQQNYQDVANAIIRQGYVDPAQFNQIRHHESHRQALAWMKTLTTEKIQELAKAVAQPGGKPNKSKPWLELLAGMGGSSPHAVALNDYENLLNRKIAAGQGVVITKEEFSMRGDMRRYNQDIINLAVAYVNLIETGHIRPQPANVQNNNNIPAPEPAAQPQRPAQGNIPAGWAAYQQEPQRNMGQQQQQAERVMGAAAQLFAAFLNPVPQQMRQPERPRQNVQERLAPDYGVMEFRPIRQEDGSVLYRAPTGDLFYYDWGINDYVMLD